MLQRGRGIRKIGKQELEPQTIIQREYEVGIREKEIELEEREAKLNREMAKLNDQLQNSRRKGIITVILTGGFMIALIFSLAIIFIDAFHFWGVDIETSTVTLLATSTIGELSGLLVILYKEIIKN